MTPKLNVMKTTITDALELESMSNNETVKAYFRGKAVGVLEVAMYGVLSVSEHKKLCDHYESERKRLI